MTAEFYGLESLLHTVLHVVEAVRCGLAFGRARVRWNRVPRPAEEFVYRLVGVLPDDIPERDLEMPGPWSPEVHRIQFVPEVADRPGVFTHKEQFSEFLVLHPTREPGTRGDAGDARVGDDLEEHDLVHGLLVTRLPRGFPALGELVRQRVGLDLGYLHTSTLQNESA